jgi:hypothetical protein
MTIGSMVKHYCYHAPVMAECGSLLRPDQEIKPLADCTQTVAERSQHLCSLRR